MTHAILLSFAFLIGTTDVEVSQRSTVQSFWFNTVDDQTHVISILDAKRFESEIVWNPRTTDPPKGIRLILERANGYVEKVSSFRDLEFESIALRNTGFGNRSWHWLVRYSRRGQRMASNLEIAVLLDGTVIEPLMITREEYEHLVKLRRVPGSSFGFAKDGKVLQINVSESDVEDSILVTAAKFPMVEEINATWSQIVGHGCKDLVNLTRLKRLDLHASRRLDDLAMSSIAKLTSLVYLDLSSTGVSDKGVFELASLTKLEVLRINGTSVTDKLEGSILKMKNLTHLGISETAITTECVNRLKLQRPSLVVEY